MNEAPVRTASADDVGFGAAEMAYLLSRYEPGAMARVAGLLRVDLAAATPAVLAAGASSLVAHGFAELQGEDVVLRGEAAVLAYALVKGEHWTELGFLAARDQFADGALMIQAPEAVVLLQPRSLGTWYLVMKDPEVTPRDAVRILAEAYLDSHPGSAVFLGAHTSTWTATMFLRRGDTSAWELVRGAAPFWVEATAGPAGDGEVNAALDALLAVPGD